MDGPNLSIIVPGPCNAKCGFCFWKNPGKVADTYIQDLKKTLDSMPEQFHQISLTGGEPTISKYLPDVLKVIDRSKYTKIVLTSNGTRLLEFLRNDKDWKNFPYHINISRHHHNDVINAKIFNSKSIIDTDKLKATIQMCHYNNIDVTLNCVLTGHLNNYVQVSDFIRYAKNIGADGVCFRKQHGNIDPSEQEKMFENMPVIGEGHCPVCRTKVQKILGMEVTWKTSCSEPSKELGELYEAIIHPDGRVTQDWEGKIEMSSSRDEALSRIGDALIAIGNELKSLVAEQKPVKTKPVQYEGCKATHPKQVSKPKQATVRPQIKMTQDCEECKKREDSRGSFRASSGCGSGASCDTNEGCYPVRRGC